ncbi:hypothetical protein ABEB36_007130 [Hypothenemus hampei]|uniref:Uncharacterized protein n=1 Tax=Hypothenemus hampei TaxID=57062 RepID=A0ABD1ETF0_HYPHA
MDISSLLKYYKSSWWSLSGCFKEVMCQDRKLLLSNLLWILGLLYPLAGNENIRNIDCAYAVLKEIHPAFAEIYFIIMTTYLYVTSIVVVALPATLFYSIWMQQSQFSKLAEYIDVKTWRSILETLGVTVLVIDENYHNNVSEKLNFIIKRHVQLLGFFHKRTEYLSIKITGFLFGLCGGFLAISAAVNIIKGERIFLSIILISIVCMGLEMDTGATQAYENAVSISRKLTKKLVPY